jgi:hypothetical protein
MRAGLTGLPAPWLGSSPRAQAQPCLVDTGTVCKGRRVTAIKHQAGDITGGIRRGGQQAVCAHFTQLGHTVASGALPKTRCPEGCPGTVPPDGGQGNVGCPKSALWDKGMAPDTHNQVLLLPVDPHRVDGMDRRLLRELPGFLVQRRQEGHVDAHWSQGSPQCLSLPSGVPR